MPAAIDLTNKTIGRLRVQYRLEERNKYGKRLWSCLCDPELGGCGKVILVQSSHLAVNQTVSCGCYSKDITKLTNTKHGYTKFPEYKVWNTIKDRCYAPHSSSYKEYGGRGIGMSDDWKNSFEAFYRDMGPRPSKDYSIERGDNSGSYSKENCRWATRTEQANNRRSSVYFEFDGKRQTLAQWCRELDLSYSKTQQRVKKLRWSFFSVIHDALANRLITHSVNNLVGKEETQTLEFWCSLYTLDKERTYMRIFRGEKFEAILAE